MQEPFETFIFACKSTLTCNCKLSSQKEEEEDGIEVLRVKNVSSVLDFFMFFAIHLTNFVAYILHGILL